MGSSAFSTTKESRAGDQASKRDPGLLSCLVVVCFAACLRQFFDQIATNHQHLARNKTCVPASSSLMLIEFGKLRKNILMSAALCFDCIGSKHIKNLQQI